MCTGVGICIVLVFLTRNIVSLVQRIEYYLLVLMFELSLGVTIHVTQTHGHSSCKELNLLMFLIMKWHTNGYCEELHCFTKALCKSTVLWIATVVIVTATSNIDMVFKH